MNCPSCEHQWWTVGDDSYGCNHQEILAKGIIEGREECHRLLIEAMGRVQGEDLWQELSLLFAEHKK